MRLSLPLVLYVAKLAALPLSAQEEDRYSKQISKILDYIKQLDKLDTKDVPIFNVTGLSSILKVDELTHSLPQDEVFKNILNKKSGFFVTKGIFEE